MKKEGYGRIWKGEWIFNSDNLSRMSKDRNDPLAISLKILKVYANKEKE